MGQPTADTVAPEISPQRLAEMCFRHVPEDVRLRARAVVLVALWHLHRRAAQVGLPLASTFSQRLLGHACGLDTHTFRDKLDDLIDERLVARSAHFRLSLTAAGYREVGRLVDVDQAMRLTP